MKVVTHSKDTSSVAQWLVYWIHNPKTIDQYYPLLDFFLFFSLTKIASEYFSITNHLPDKDVNDDEMCALSTIHTLQISFCNTKTFVSLKSKFLIRSFSHPHAKKALTDEAF